METTWTINVNFSEAIALASLLKMNMWLGLPTLRANSEDEVAQLAQLGYQTLQEKNILAVHEDHPVSLFEPVKRLMDAIRFPHSVIVLTSPGITKTIFMTNDVLLEQEINQDGTINLTWVKDKDALAKHCVEFLDFPNKSDAPEKTIKIPFSLVENASTTSMEVVEHDLENFDLPIELSKAIMEWLKGENPFRCITELNSINPAEIDEQYCWLVAEETAWLMEMDHSAETPGNVRFSSTGKKVLVKHISDIISHQTA